MRTMNSPSDSFLHSPFCFLSSLVAPSLAPTLASGGYFFCVFLPLGTGVCFLGCSGRFMAGRVSGVAERLSAIGSYAQVDPTDNCPE